MTIEFDQNELDLFRDNVRRYVESKIMPHYEQWEKDGIIPREIWRQLGEVGFLCVDIPEEYGGFAVDFRFSMLVLEEFSRQGCIGVGGGIAVHSDIVAHYILNTGSEEQKKTYLPKMVSGESVGAIAMTEPGAGSDLQGMRTNAKLEGDADGISSLTVLNNKTTISNIIPEVLEDAVRQLEEYFKGERIQFSLILNPQGTDFQKRVWNALLDIPYGKTTSYLQLSKDLGDVKAIRAVANANGKNPIWIIVPCHRVIGSDGSLTGYTGGLHRKQWLLEHESPYKQQSLF